MSDDLISNDQLVLICGESGSGKSASLRNIRNQKKWGYLNCEAGKRLPFRNDFQQAVVTDPYEVWSTFDYAIENPNEFDGLALDTITFLMDMMESVHVKTATNSQKAWGDYADFLRVLMQQKVAKFRKPVVILGHTKSELDEAAMQMRTSVPVKGSLKNNGVEAFFTTVVATKKVTLKELEPYHNDLLTISEDDEMLGYKHVFQTRLTKTTTGERIRSPMGMFTKEQTFIDNDAQLLLDHLHKFYH